MLRALRNRLSAAASPRPASPVAPDHPPSLDWASVFRGVDLLGAPELRILSECFDALADDGARLRGAKAILEYFAGNSHKARLFASSEFYLQPHLDSIAVRLAFIASSYVVGQSRRGLRVAESLAADWASPLTAILLARVREDLLGAAAEHAALASAAERFPDDVVVKYNLIENLIGTDRVEDANQAMEAMRSVIERGLADEIAAVKRNQEILEQAIAAGSYAPAGDEDIYTDQMCRSYWTSYYQSFVTRLPRQHGDRLLLELFTGWVREVDRDVDVVLDFGSLCAQPVYEAALAAPHIRFIGTDRQEFIAAMNRAAYPLANLGFEHGDIFEVMERVAQLPGRKALTHVRTTCTLYPRFVEELYRAGARLGFAHIYLIENAGLVRSRLRFMRYETMEEPALVTKHRLNLHNYREFLSRAGYSVRRFARVRAPGLWRGEHPANYLGSQYAIHAVLND